MESPRLIILSNENLADTNQIKEFRVFNGQTDNFWLKDSENVYVVVIDEENVERVLNFPQGTFVIMVSDVQELEKRDKWSKMGVNAIIPSSSLVQLLEKIVKSTFNGPRQVKCPFCPAHLSRDQLWWHVPLFHTQLPNTTEDCPICGKSAHNWAVHLHDNHIASDSHHISQKFTRQPVYSLIVVQRVKNGVKEYLMIEEAASQGWWLPGGGVDLGESMIDAAARECLEEAGVKVKIIGLLRMQHFARRDHSRFSAVWLAEPLDDGIPKHFPDFESKSACWTNFADLKRLVGDGKLKLRGSEPLKWFEWVENGEPVHDLGVYSYIT